MSVARNETIELAFDVAGQGPDLLLIAGTASTRPIWTLVRPALSEKFRTIAFDPRDAGDSSSATGQYSLDDLAADALAVLDAAGSTRAHVVGHSLGGAVAQALGLLAPERCASLSLVCTWARGDDYSRSVVSLLSALTDELREDRTLLASILYFGNTVETLRKIDLFTRTDAAMALGPLIPRAGLQRQWALDLQVDTLERTRALRMPVQVVWSPEDRMLPPPHSQLLAEAIPNSTLACIQGCGHLPMIDAPEAFANLIAEFVEGIEGSQLGVRKDQSHA